MKKTIRDIANACGVSVSLVSRIINNDPSLKCKQETKNKVMMEVEKQAFIPDQNARVLANNSFKNKKNIRIGYITYKGGVLPMNPYFDKVVEGITVILAEQGCQVYRYYVDEVNELSRLKRPMESFKFDGLIVFGNLHQKLVEYIKTQTKYISSIYGDIIEDADFVGSDILTTMNTMLDYVKSLGYEEIGLVSGGDEAREEQLMLHLEKIGMRIADKYFINAGNENAKAYKIISGIIKETPPPKVICCMNDEMAIGTMNALLDGGYRVPEDVSVTGHDDITKASYSKVPLTTVKIYKEEIGRLVTDLLLERIIYRRKFPVKVTVPCALAIRESLIKNKG